MVIIGLTGGTGTGKSTVATILAAVGARVIDADEIGRELVEPGSEVIQEIARTFGQRVINSDGSLNRRELGRICFSERRQLLRLNAIMHPRIRSRVESLIGELQRQHVGLDNQDGTVAVVIDAAVLFESGLDRIADTVIAVTADPEVRVARLVQRMGLSETEARARIAAQRSDEEFAGLSDFAIDTTGGVDSYAGRVRSLFREILREHGS